MDGFRKFGFCLIWLVWIPHNNYLCWLYQTIGPWFLQNSCLEVITYAYNSSYLCTCDIDEHGSKLDPSHVCIYYGFFFLILCFTFDGQNSLGTMSKLISTGRTISVIVSRPLLVDGRKVKLIVHFSSAYSFFVRKCRVFYYTFAFLAWDWLYLVTFAYIGCQSQMRDRKWLHSIVFYSGFTDLNWYIWLENANELGYEWGTIVALLWSRVSPRFSVAAVVATTAGCCSLFVCDGGIIWKTPNALKMLTL